MDAQHTTEAGTSFDVLMFSEMKKAIPALLNKGGNTNAAPMEPDIYEDIYRALVRPVRRPEEQIPHQLLPQRAVLERITKHRDFEGLRSETINDPLSAALATVAIAKCLSLEEYTGAQGTSKDQAQSKREKLQEQLRQQHEKSADRNQGDETRRHAQADARQVEEQIRNKDRAEAKKQRALEEKGESGDQGEQEGQEKKAHENQARNITNGSAPGEAYFLASLDKAIHTAARNVKQKGDLQEIFGEPGQMAGDDGNMIQRAVDIAQMVKLQSSNKMNKDLLSRLAGILGHIERVADRIRNAKAEAVSGVLTRFTLGAELTKLTPFSMAHAGTPELLPGFMRDFAEHELQQYETHDLARAGRGPVVFEIDHSGSMWSDSDSRQFPGVRKQDLAAAVAIALMREAAKDGRRTALIKNATETVSLEFEGELSTRDIVEALSEPENSLGGGDDGGAWVEHAIRIIEKDEYKNADLFMCCDGNMVDEVGFKERGIRPQEAIDAKNRLGFRVFCILVDKDRYRDSLVNEDRLYGGIDRRIWQPGENGFIDHIAHIDKTTDGYKAIEEIFTTGIVEEYNINVE